MLKTYAIVLFEQCENNLSIQEENSKTQYIYSVECSLYIKMNNEEDNALKKKKMFNK